MKSISLRIMLLAGIMAFAASCAGVVAALLVRELLNDEAPKRTWTGSVLDDQGAGVGGVLVQVRAEVSGDDDQISFSDETSFDGSYRIGFRWHKDVNYTIRVVNNDVVLAEQLIGKIELSDQMTDFVVNP